MASTTRFFEPLEYSFETLVKTACAKLAFLTAGVRIILTERTPCRRPRSENCFYEAA